MSVPFYVPPEQLIKDRAEYARKGIARGRPIVVLEYADGVLLIGENPNGSLHKLGEIYDRIAFAGVGRFNEFEMLRVAGIRYADVKGYSFSRSDVTARGLANAYSQTLGQIFTHEVKPYETEVVVAEIGAAAAETQIYRISFDGTLGTIEGFGALGGNEEGLAGKLADTYSDGLPLDGAVSVAMEAIASLDDREIPATDWEAAVLDRSRPRRKFHRLTPDELST